MPQHNNIRNYTTHTVKYIQKTDTIFSQRFSSFYVQIGSGIATGFLQLSIAARRVASFSLVGYLHWKLNGVYFTARGPLRSSRARAAARCSPLVTCV